MIANKKFKDYSNDPEKLAFNSEALFDRKLDDTNRKKGVRQQGGKDYFSKLPDEILMIILSRLNLRQAVKTSILSRRWRFLWTYLSGVFDFDARVLFSNKQLIGPSSPEFAQIMMNILKQHQGPTIAELRIRLPDHWVHRFFERQLHSLITMGMQKRVKSLLIDFRKFFILQEPMQRLGSVCSFTLLVSLRLINAKISAEFIHHLLSNSPALELLSIVDSSGDLGHLKFCGPCLKLKHLELRRNEIRILEISAAPHIESLELFPINKDIKIIFKDIPSLTRVSCSFIVIKELLMLRTLKEINLSLDGDCLEELHCCFNLIDASPVLTKASFNMDDYFAYWDYDYEFSNLSYYIGRPKHQCLKVVEIFGFRGHEYEQELGIYLAHYASNLRKIRVRPCAYNDDEFMTCRLQKLKSMLPPSVELEILSVNSLLF